MKKLLESKQHGATKEVLWLLPPLLLYQPFGKRPARQKSGYSAGNDTIWLFNSSPWKITILIGKPSISMGHLYHGYLKEPEGM